MRNECLLGALVGRATPRLGAGGRRALVICGGGSDADNVEDMPSSLILNPCNPSELIPPDSYEHRAPSDSISRHPSPVQSVPSISHLRDELTLSRAL